MTSAKRRKPVFPDVHRFFSIEKSIKVFSGPTHDPSVFGKKSCAARHILTVPVLCNKVRLSSKKEGHFSRQNQLPLGWKGLPWGADCGHNKAPHPFRVRRFGASDYVTIWIGNP